MSRQTFTDRRRHQSARRVAALEAMEPRNMITESLGIISMGIGVPVAAMAFGAKDARRSTAPAAKPVSHALNVTASSITRRGKTVAGGGSSNRVVAAATSHRVSSASSSDWLTLFHRGKGAKTAADHQAFTLSKPAAKSSDGGGASRGGSGGTSSGLVTPFRLPPPTPIDAGSSSAVASAALGGALGAAGNSATGASHPASASAAAGGQAATADTSAPGSGATLSPLAASGGRIIAAPTIYTTKLNSSPAAMGSFSHFPLYTLDYNNGVVLFPGVTQLATLNAPEDLRAQVRDTAVSSYSWDTTHMGDATGFAGTSTYDFTFKWKSNVPAPQSDWVTLTVTNGGGQTEVQT